MLLTIFAVISLAVSVLWADGFWIIPAFAGCFLGCILLAVAFVWVLSLFVDPEKPQEKDDPLIRWIARLYAPAVFTILRTRIETTGAEKLPKDGRFLMVCNHINVLDPGILLTEFPRSQLAFISKQENLKLPILGPLMLRILCQPLDRENDRAALKTILRCISIIKEDKASIAVFPEGYTSRDGRLQPFRNGAFKIAQKAEVPIVVCTLRGTQDIFHNFAHFKSTRVQLHLLEVIPAAALKGVSATEIGNRVHEMMEQDLGELV